MVAKQSFLDLAVSDYRHHYPSVQILSIATTYDA